MTGDDTCLVDVNSDGHPVDLVPYAREVLAICPFRNDLTVLELARMAERYGPGRYIPVDIQDRVAGRRLDVLIRRVICWAQAPKRLEQLRDPDVRRFRPFVALDIDTEFCALARRKSRRFLSADDLEPLPLKGCWRRACWCGYHTYTPEAAAKCHPDLLKKRSA